MKQNQFTNWATIEETPSDYEIGNKIQEPIDVEILEIQKDSENELNLPCNNVGEIGKNVAIDEILKVKIQQDGRPIVVDVQVQEKNEPHNSHKGSLYAGKERTHGGQICGNLTPSEHRTDLRCEYSDVAFIVDFNPLMSITQGTATATVVTLVDIGYFSINPKTSISIKCQTDGKYLRVAKTRKYFENLSPKVLEKVKNDERGRKPCTKRSPGLPEIEKRRKISKCWTNGLVAVRVGGLKGPPRYAMLGKYLRFLRISSLYVKPFGLSVAVRNG
ncbi:hypothetical protein E3N88_23729 [Mikania micrantha]|uniref:Uncharacterized protein n=1 Tax=Mikania micrantha TaxID=192012 RepID=A0A5N6NGS1_9ASTR|nr:hypothetical protein E3N88_23729 [Mikania micrantha]